MDLFLTILLYSLCMFVMVTVVFYTTVIIVNFLTIKKLTKEFPPYGGVKVVPVIGTSVNKKQFGTTVGSVSEKERMMKIALLNTFSEFQKTYFHEYRHTEQMFSGDAGLYSLIERGIESRERLMHLGVPAYDAYYNAPHEVDAREYADLMQQIYPTL